MMIDATVAPKVGFISPFGTTVCNVNHISAKDTVIQCLISAVFDQGEITFGAAVQLPEVGAVGRFSISDSIGFRGS